ncbi:CD3324 family protein [Paenibacillus sp. NPDC058174]|uniref:CD3324 family protein n=1 Tax=Paenibacillus sp. NPDC058174 TaxID=3346366 RepID=UPI0036DAEFC8
MKKYVNARDVLPKELIEEIQKYVKGQHLYIPQTDRQSWGTSTGIQDEFLIRNTEIRRKYNSGIPIKQLALMFNLSEERIRGIAHEKCSVE